ncbi:Uncharacterised protein [Klebsiella variicola]|uniref:Uncharacterized protein n=1 Tax=Klebsiella variicola TaxID=244366 RepID=A0A7H4N469_KLEVA|nr:Uncharacterised protein [Klebsiella variicola]
MWLLRICETSIDGLFSCNGLRDNARSSCCFKNMGERFRCEVVSQKCFVIA